MTEKIRDRLNSWLVGFVFVLLGWIAGGVGYLIVHTNDKLDYYEKQQDANVNDIKNIANILEQDPDTQEKYQKELRKIYFNSRGTTTSN